MSAKFKLGYFCPASLRDYKKLNPSAKHLVNIAYKKLEERADTIGQPLSGQLAGCRKLKFKKENLRIVYRITENNTVEIVEIIAIGKRENNHVYTTAEKRIRK
jgi:mRNA interferase RelE/StbE